MKAPFSYIPAVPAAIGFGCGIAAGAADAPETAVWLVATTAFVLGILVWIIFKNHLLAAVPVAFTIGAAVAIVSLPDTGKTYVPARGALAEAIYLSPMQGPTAAFAATTLIADGTYLDDTLRDNFRGAGLAHVLALSGFHVGIIAMIAYWLTSPLAFFRKGRLPRAALVMAAVWAFAFIGGCAPSLLRAAIMCTLLLATRMAGRYPSTLNSLAVAAVIILLWSPHSLFRPGFQLSFAAVAGIVLFARPLNPFNRRNSPWLHKAASLVTVSLSATAATAPIIAATFGSLPLFFLPANIAVTLLFGPFYIVALTVTLLSISGIEAVFLSRIADTLYSLMAATAEFFNASVEVSAPPHAIALCVALLLSSALLLNYKRLFSRP